MLHGMLSREGDGLPDACGHEYLALAVETIESVVDIVDRILVNRVTSNEVAEVQERAESADHLSRYVGCDSGKVDLQPYNNSQSSITVITTALAFIRAFESSAPSTGKKSRAAVVRAKVNKPSALVANWEDVARLREPSLTPPTEIPDDISSLPGTRPSSRLSTTSSVPPSTTGDTTDSDGLGLVEGESAIDEDAATYPVPNTAEPRTLARAPTGIRVNDVRDALRYRSQQVELACECRIMWRGF